MTGDEAWRPTATIATLGRRAARVARIRAFFAERSCLEVTTPVAVRRASSEPTLTSLAIDAVQADAPRGYLRTSPEAAMKRLLAAGSGDIYQLGPAFRAEEHGRHHRTEFTLLEWYRVGWNHHALMDEVEALLRELAYTGAVRRISYTTLFAEALGHPPQDLTNRALADCAERAGLNLSTTDRDDRTLLLDALFACVIEPRLAGLGAVLLHDYPMELRAYARLSSSPTPVAERFELIIDGLEIANGYHEITDADEQAACFAQDAAVRAARTLPGVPPDADWLAALRAGLPACAGVALGLERLLMALDGQGAIDQVISFADELC